MHTVLPLPDSPPKFTLDALVGAAAVVVEVAEEEEAVVAAVVVVVRAVAAAEVGRAALAPRLVVELLLRLHNEGQLERSTAQVQAIPPATWVMEQ